MNCIDGNILLNVRVFLFLFIVKEMLINLIVSNEI